MPDAQAQEYFSLAMEALQQENYTSAMHTLIYVTEGWENYCDPHRALAFARDKLGRELTPLDEIKKIRDTLDTYDEMTTAVWEGYAEHGLTTTWVLPKIPIVFPLSSRGQIRAGYAALLVSEGRYAEAAAELQLAEAAPTLHSENAAVATKAIAAVRGLLMYETERWDDVIAAVSPLTTAGSSGDFDQILLAYGHAMTGTALAHMGSHAIGQEKLEHAVQAGYRAVGGWASLELGLSRRAAGDEEGAQKAFSGGLQFQTGTDALQDALQNKSRKMRITTAAVIAARTDPWDPATEPDVADFERTSSQEERRTTLTDALEVLDRLDGMQQIKERIETMGLEIAFENEQRRRGLAVKPKTRHLIFKGPPGTGKTTIAQLVVALYYGLGVIRHETLVDANRAKLVAEYEGQSGPKTLAKLEEARGGVIFIDEAYELVQERPGQKDAFGHEALTALLEYMDNHRDDIIVIIAGYEAPIERFLQENPGLKSRFAYSLSFKTYSADEMWRIINGMAVADGRSIDPRAENFFKQTIEIMHDTDASRKKVLDNAGNGRFARNVFEQAQGLAAKRLMRSGGDLSALSDAELMQLSAEDIHGAMAQILAGYSITHLPAIA
ncbi:Type VII secretion system protein EccA1 (plasmid) [Tsukamurella tyrosinosolvens]|uniref:Type VII secretion AAA-ATPase EccA n=1 Tax=Tsukamurella tyrosinosolvens TaxID=57704 RepID=A0A1H4VSW1_TSUTY|nr:AAA family ATPase [Tsukamurella tyrosinosolvens]KXO90606.1 ATPase [Tsukamurella tyrosinosolvens]SEC83960.1 type VII secretion AAA-ATPase EccA [Tsukamurella tyrosinosolvens]VEH90324.1 Type VII secretion system protein EccA1 [Tsukamurella tyrosinosolvens]